MSVYSYPIIFAIGPNKRKETGIGTVFQYYYISRKMFVRFSWKTINSGQLCS